MRRVHLTIGILALMLFAATGMVMRSHHPPLRTLGDDVRLMHRSRHIYLLAGAVANLLLGMYLVPGSSALRRGLQNAGSILFLAAPILLGFAFFAETGHGISAGVWRSTLGLFALLAGTVLHFVATVRAV